MVAEIHMVKDNAAVRHLITRIFGVDQVGFLIEYLGNTLRARNTHRHHNENHRNHHQVHQDRHTVGQKACKLTCCKFRIVRSDNQLRAKPTDQKDTGVYRNLHDGAVVRYRFLRFYKHIVNTVARRLEFILLMVFAHIRFDHADGRHILLHARV